MSSTSFVWLSFACLALVSPAAAMTVVPPSFEELVEGSGEIARARVISTEPFRTTSASGASIIKTRVTWQVLRKLKGEHAETLSLDFLGGRMGDEEIRVAGMPEFEIGQEDYLFVEPDTRVFCPLYAAGHGRYRILAESRTGRAYVARANGAPLIGVSQVAVPLSQNLLAPMAARSSDALSPEAFESAILETLRDETPEHAK
ncbi:MAG: hypothetical protein ACREIA_17485 [Opitutaceae bacterium]